MLFNDGVERLQKFVNIYVVLHFQKVRQGLVTEIGMTRFPPKSDSVSSYQMRKLGRNFLDPISDILQQFLVIFVLQYITDPVPEHRISTANSEETQQKTQLSFVSHQRVPDCTKVNIYQFLYLHKYTLTLFWVKWSSINAICSRT